MKTARVLRSLALGMSSLVALTASAQDTRPTVAVLFFNNGALGKNSADLAPLSKGIQDFLITEMGANTKIRLVERDKIQQIVEELNLNVSDKVDKETAVKIGKLLGAHHMITGGFMTDPKGSKLRIDARSFSVETGLIEYTTFVSDKPDALMEEIVKLAGKLNDGLKLPALDHKVGEVREAQAKKVPTEAVMLYARAENARDGKDKTEAIKLYKAAIAKYPNYARAEARLKELEGSASR